MLKDKEVQQVILHTLAELRRTIKASEKENYTKGELLDLLKKVGDFMTSMECVEDSAGE